MTLVEVLMTLYQTALIVTLMVTDMVPMPAAARHPSPASTEPFTPVLAALTDQTEAIVAQLGINSMVSARQKTPSSLHIKARRKGIRPDQVLDRIGLRIIVPEVSDCYSVQQAIRARYPLVQDSHDDYIAVPKPNGYQSLHMAARTPLGVAEFQIRTAAMHSHAESGPAAHWRYKQHG
jgi:GTP pyrophosphokinase